MITKMNPFIVHVVIVTLQTSILLATFYTFFKGGVEYSCIQNRAGTLTDVGSTRANKTSLAIFADGKLMYLIEPESYNTEKFNHFRWLKYNHETRKHFYVYFEVSMMNVTGLPQGMINLNGTEFFEEDSGIDDSRNHYQKGVSYYYVAIFDRDCRLTEYSQNKVLSVLLSLLSSTFMFTIAFCLGLTKIRIGSGKLSDTLDNLECYYIQLTNYLGIPNTEFGLYCYNKDGTIYHSSDKNKYIEFKPQAGFKSKTVGFDKYIDKGVSYTFNKSQLFKNGVEVPINVNNEHVVESLKDCFWYNEYLNYPMVESRHCISVEKAIVLLQQGFSISIDDKPGLKFRTPYVDELFFNNLWGGEIELRDILVEHNKIFFSKLGGNFEALYSAIYRGMYFCYRPTSCNNSSWKMYCSDVAQIYRDFGINKVSLEKRKLSKAYYESKLNTRKNTNSPSDIKLKIELGKEEKSVILHCLDSDESNSNKDIEILMGLNSVDCELTAGDDYKVGDSSQLDNTKNPNELMKSLNSDDIVRDFFNENLINRHDGYLEVVKNSCDLDGYLMNKTDEEIEDASKFNVRVMDEGFNLGYYQIVGIMPSVLRLTKKVTRAEQKRLIAKNYFGDSTKGFFEELMNGNYSAYLQDFFEKSLDLNLYEYERVISYAKKMIEGFNSLTEPKLKDRYAFLNVRNEVMSDSTLINKIKSVIMLLAQKEDSVESLNSNDTDSAGIDTFKNSDLEGESKILLNKFFENAVNLLNDKCTVKLNRFKKVKNKGYKDSFRKVQVSELIKIYNKTGPNLQQSIIVTAFYKTISKNPGSRVLNESVFLEDKKIQHYKRLGRIFINKASKGCVSSDAKPKRKDKTVIKDEMKSPTMNRMLSATSSNENSRVAELLKLNKSWCTAYFTQMTVVRMKSIREIIDLLISDFDLQMVQIHRLCGSTKAKL